MSESDWIWAGLILLGAAYETYALVNTRDGDTLSEAVRALFRVRTSRAGRCAFLALWLAFAGWFAGHIADWWA